MRFKFVNEGSRGEVDISYGGIKELDKFPEVIELTFSKKTTNTIDKLNDKQYPLKDLDFECFPDRKKIKFSFQIKHK